MRGRIHRHPGISNPARLSADTTGVSAHIVARRPCMVAAACLVLISGRPRSRQEDRFDQREVVWRPHRDIFSAAGKGRHTDTGRDGRHHLVARTWPHRPPDRR